MKERRNPEFLEKAHCVELKKMPHTKAYGFNSLRRLKPPPQQPLTPCVPPPSPPPPPLPLSLLSSPIPPFSGLWIIRYCLALSLTQLVSVIRTQTPAFQDVVILTVKAYQCIQGLMCPNTHDVYSWGFDFLVKFYICVAYGF